MAIINPEMETAEMSLVHRPNVGHRCRMGSNSFRHSSGSDRDDFLKLLLNDANQPNVLRSFCLPMSEGSCPICGHMLEK
jgi:hypothetical protein